MGVGAGEVYSPAARELERLNLRNYRIAPDDGLGSGSLKQKARDNFAAIELVHWLETAGRGATDEEKSVLVRYVGWGGMPQVFAENGPADWAVGREELKRLLSPDEYELARATTLNAHSLFRLGIASSRRHFPRMSTVICYRTKEEIDKEVAAIHRVGVENAKSKKKARAFLIKAGFITKDGKQLAEPYR